MIFWIINYSQCTTYSKVTHADFTQCSSFTNAGFHTITNSFVKGTTLMWVTWLHTLYLKGTYYENATAEVAVCKKLLIWSAPVDLRFQNWSVKAFESWVHSWSQSDNLQQNHNPNLKVSVLFSAEMLPFAPHQPHRTKLLHHIAEDKCAKFIWFIARQRNQWM